MWNVEDCVGRRQTFPKSNRVRRSKTFTLALRRGGCAADDCLVVFAIRSGESAEDRSAKPARRLGITIPKKTGNAVVRNRWKRWIRESFRTQQDQFPEGVDLIVRPKKDARGSWNKIRRGLPKLARKAVSRIKDELPRS
jgi:ribonuclease P protein component